MRTPAGELEAYHTSMDTLDTLDEDALLDSVQALYRFVQVLERDVTYVNSFKGEPCLARHHIAYPSFHEDKGAEAKYIVKKLIHELDGSHSLLEIADKWDIPLDRVAIVADQLRSAGLVKPAPAKEDEHQQFSRRHD